MTCLYVCIDLGGGDLGLLLLFCDPLVEMKSAVEIKTRHEI